MEFTLNPHPKPYRKKLTKKELIDLRHRMYHNRNGICSVCGEFMFPDEMALHHIKTKGSGGDDVEENLLPVHKLCHIKIHNGEI